MHTAAQARNRLGDVSEGEPEILEPAAPQPLQVEVVDAGGRGGGGGAARVRVPMPAWSVTVVEVAMVLDT